MFVDLDFRTMAPPGLSVPAEVILDSGLRKIVYLQTGEDIFEPRPIEIGTAYGERVSIVGISQDDAGDTREFCAEYGVSFPALVDADGYAVSNQYGITNVPTVYLIAPDGKVTVSSEGFSRADLEKISAELGRHSGRTAAAVFHPDEVIPDYKPG
jgi:hypothetical protein